MSKFFFILLFSVILTMTLPAVYSTEFSYDLRIIPIIIAFIYGGMKPGLSLTAVMLGLTYFLNPTMFFPTLGNYIVASVILIYLHKKYHKQTNKNKVIILSVFYLLIAASRGIFLLQEGYTYQFSISLFLSFVTLITLISVIMLIETLRKQITLHRELEHIEKMNAISQLAASVAHEIRNPMTTVRGFLQILSTSKDIPETDRSFISISIEELDRAQTIINEYLSLSKPQESALEVVDFSKVINDSIQVISTYAIINNVEISKAIDEEIRMKCYKHEIQQVFINIMKNGIESMDSNGRMHVAATRQNKYVKIIIQDNGCGIPKEQLKSLGTPYHSTKEQGTGLGLTVSYEIIKRMNGSIDVHSKVGQGTTFTILLPTTD
ncbi:ATP-binding protein [Pseudalkalibacillus berkeleyi]|uniref:histidine kinase n=1 Tax=Pseudalkalibacillus berkeleyi TaxID=1069813 RepID=A0ABS9H236_9BACL|nr:ATP-binding protein [Pseudalkalibacillus berkeleyi]MCF6139032.1 ATP-binding protein [Pseudalkalibacillus berkeleyi]